MRARRLAVGLLAALVLLGGAVAACSTKMTLRKAAVGTWNCVPPKSSDALPLTIVVKDGGAFTVTYQRRSGQDQTITGGWNLDGSTVNISFTGQAAIVPPILVTGAEEDARSITMRAAEDSGLQAVPKAKIVVARKGWNQVTFRNAAPGSITYTCSKQ